MCGVKAGGVSLDGVDVSKEAVVQGVVLHEGEPVSPAYVRLLRDERSASEVDAPVLVVSQFTLYGDVRKGRRPTWAAAAPGPVAEPLYEAFCAELERLGATVARGVFGADMAVSLVNDGPVTLLLETPAPSGT